MKSILFEPTKVAQLSLKNKIMRSPCFMHGCDNTGLPTKSLLKYYQDLADGQMGLIIPGYFYLHTQGKASNAQGGMENDMQADAWKETVKYIHKQGSKIVFQVCDAGVATTFDACKEMPRGAYKINDQTRTMTKAEIAEVIENYVTAAKRIQRIGVDGIQIHAAHGYLVSQFLSPAVNKRDDEYGGSPENRRRILKEISSEIRKATGKDFFISAKINGEDCIPGGLTPEDFAQTVKAVKDIDMFEVSCGVGSAALTIRSTLIPRVPGYENMSAYNVGSMEIAKKANPNASFAVVGGFRKIEEMEDAIKRGADLVSLGRPTIADPKVVKHLMEGKKIKCVSCGLCIINSTKGPVHCFI
jgi:2,4-dienoyl-CoA reductase-like NADH-dependent reductase (Old Yellow Enzyme family)